MNRLHREFRPPRGRRSRREDIRPEGADEVECVQVSNFPREVHDLASLATMHAHLFASRAAA